LLPRCLVFLLCGYLFVFPVILVCVFSLLLVLYLFVSCLLLRFCLIIMCLSFGGCRFACALCGCPLLGFCYGLPSFGWWGPHRC
jgi:hypothetical protein